MSRPSFKAGCTAWPRGPHERRYCGRAPGRPVRGPDLPRIRHPRPLGAQAREIVPGSAPTTAAAAGDVGLSGLTRTLHNASPDFAAVHRHCRRSGPGLRFAPLRRLGPLLHDSDTRPSCGCCGSLQRSAPGMRLRGKHEHAQEQRQSKRSKLCHPCALQIYETFRCSEWPALAMWLGPPQRQPNKPNAEQCPHRRLRHSRGA